MPLPAAPIPRSRGSHRRSRRSRGGAPVRATRLALVLALGLGILAWPAPATSADPDVGPSRAAAPAGTTCSPWRPAAHTTTTRTINVNGETRTYLIKVPRPYSGHLRVPLVFTFHGLGSAANQQLFYSQFPALADRENFLLVAPEGRGSPRRFDFYSTPSSPHSDAAFTQKLLDYLSDHFCVDFSRRFATGMSNGSAVTFNLACIGYLGFSAYGSVAATYYIPQCAAARPAPIIYFHGTKDPVVPFNGGPTIGASVQPAPDVLQKWASHNHCRYDYTSRYVSPHVSRRAWRGCRSGADVDFYVVHGGGHTWPGSIDIPRLGATTHEISAAQLMWDFFKAHSGASAVPASP